MVTMDELAVANLTIDGNFNFETIDMMIRYNIRCLCFEEPEKNYIHKTSIAIAPSFYNIANLYIKHTVINGIKTDYNELIILCNKFIDSLRSHIWTQSITRSESTGLLFTWIPIVMALHREAMNMNDEELSNATEYLETKVHDFAMLHLKISLKRDDNF